MDNDQRMFPFSEHHQLFAELLIKTAGSSHGRLPLLQEDDHGGVWEVLLPMTREMAWRLLWEAQGGDLHTPAGERMGMSHMDSLLPLTEQFIIFSGDRDYLYGLYTSTPIGNTQRYYVIRGKGERYYHLQLRGRYQSDARQQVYETLRQLYGMELPPPASRVLTEGRGALVPE